MRTDEEKADRPLRDPEYAERQFIMVADDAVLEHIRLKAALEEAEAKVANSAADVGDWAKYAATIVAAAFPATRIPALAIAGYELAKRAIEAWGRASQSVNIKLVSMSEARTITFPPGHPKIDVLYIGHPGIANRYCTTADFHRVVFEHKFAEAVRLLMALGATTIEVHHVTGWSKEFMGSMSLPLPVGSAGAGAGSEESEAKSLLLRAELGTEGRQDPFIPSDLVWYPNEYLWQVVAKGRIEHQLTRCQLAVSYLDDFSVNGELHGVVAGNGRGKAALDLGGTWNDHESTIWRIDAVFGPDVAELVRSSGTKPDPE